MLTDERIKEIFDNSIVPIKGSLLRMARALEAEVLQAQEPVAWTPGYPRNPWDKEWFIALTTYGDRVVLKALPETYSYDFKTADDTYMKKENIKAWMQFPDSDFVAPQPPAPCQCADPEQIIALQHAADTAEAQTRENEKLRATNRELNRRCQKAESAALAKVAEADKVGGYFLGSANQYLVDQLRAEVTRLQGELLAQADVRRVLGERDELRDKVEQLQTELETERMRLAACSVVALANTPESAKVARTMRPEHESASCRDVARAVDREMGLRADVERLTAENNRQAIGWNNANSLVAQQAERIAELDKECGSNLRMFQAAILDLASISEALDCDPDDGGAAPIIEAIDELKGRIAAQAALIDRIKQEARMHAQEARAANSTIYEIYQVISGATGEPGNWNGAEPVRAYVKAQVALIEKCEKALKWCPDFSHVKDALAAIAAQKGGAA